MTDKPTYEELERRVLELERAESERKLEGLYRSLSNEVLLILNEPEDFESSIRRVLEAVKETTGCDAAGLRLHSGEDFPYFLQDGFSDDFLLKENSLLERDRNGEICRNHDGTVRLECTCGLILTGEVDLSDPLFTSGGSAWTNDSFPILDLPESDDPRHHPRNECIHQGYASVALIPVRAKGSIVGLLQVNGHAKGLFTPGAIQALERIASDIGEALVRKKTEEALRERVKELNCLQTVAELIEREHNIEKILQKCPEIMVTGWSCPEIACARIIFEDRRYQTSNFRETGWRQSADLKVTGRTVGMVDLFYLEERPVRDEGPFSKEERNLLDMIAERLGRVVEGLRAEEKIHKMAYYDSLTGLPNRALFSDRLGIALAQARRNKRRAAVIMLDLDDFKDVNDNLGHDVGDLLLRASAERLSASLRDSDTIARFGGDEFLLLLTDLKEAEDAGPVAEKIVDSFRKPFLVGTHKLFVTTSIGIAVYPDDGTKESVLLKEADSAMYQAKRAGKDRYKINIIENQ